MKKKKTNRLATSAKSKSVAKRAAQKKTAPKNIAAENVDEYFAAIPQPARRALSQIRQAIRSVVPREATEIISYKIPAFKHRKIIVWYAAFAKYCSLFPTNAVIEEFKDELKDFSTSKGTVHFPLDKPMPIALIKKLVKARITRILAE